METQTVEVKVCIHSFLFYKNLVFPAQAEYYYFSESLKIILNKGDEGGSWGARESLFVSKQPTKSAFGEYGYV